MTRTFAIGDIHGHYSEFVQLMFKLVDEAKLNFNKDKLVFLGDYVDGGPDTKKVINLLMKYQKAHPHWVFLYGNHEDLMLDALIGKQKKYGDYYIWYNQGGKATIHSYVPKRTSGYNKAIMQPLDFIPMKHIDWIRQLPWSHEDEKYIYVHAGLTPGYTLYNHIHDEPSGIKEKMIWIRQEFFKSNFDFGKKIIFGHTPFEREPFITEKYIGIDMMTRYGGKLCAVELPAEKFYFQESLHDPSF